MTYVIVVCAMKIMHYEFDCEPELFFNILLRFLCSFYNKNCVVVVYSCYSVCLRNVVCYMYHFTAGDLYAYMLVCIVAFLC